MAHRVHSKEQLKTLLECTSQQIFSILLNDSPLNNQSFYQNFTAISLRAIKYINSYLNQLNSDQQMGKIIDETAKGLSEALREYKGRNIFVHSQHIPQEEHPEEEDEIYHFMNTRNNNLPSECLSNYENDKQRKELEEFVEEMKRRATPKKKETKRSLMLPKDATFDLKIGRKRTFDPDPLRQTNTPQDQNQTQLNQLPLPLNTSQHAQTQTQCDLPEEQHPQLQPEDKKSQLQIPSQCISVSVSDAALTSLSHNHLANSGNSKRKEKKKNGLGDSDGKKKKTKFAATTQNLYKPIDPLRERQKSRQKSKKLPEPSNQCSLKLLKASDSLAICSKQVDFLICNTEDFTITINYTINENTIIPSQSKTITIIDESEERNQTERKDDEDIVNKTSIKGSSSNLLMNGISENQIIYCKQPSSASRKEVHETTIENDIEKKDTNADLKKKYIIMKSNPKLNRQSQKIPISTIKIIESKQNQSQHSTPLPSYPSIQIKESKVKTIKRKKFTGDRHLFQSFILSQAESDNINISQNLRTSKINIQMLESLIKKEGDDESKSPSFAKNDQESLSSSISQDYLVSREKNDPFQMVSKLMELQKQAEREEILSSAKRDTPTFNNKTSNLQSSCSYNDQSIKGSNQMIRISNAHRMTQEIGKKIKLDHSKLFDNSKITSGMQKGKGSESNQQLKHSFLKKHHLSRIAQNTSTEHQETSSFGRPSLQNHSRSESQTIGIASQGQYPQKSIFYRQSTEILPVRVLASKMRGDIRSQSGSNSSPHKMGQSSSCHAGSFQFQSLKRKLRNRAYQDKLTSYLQLIEATHQQFCGRDCAHIKELFTGKEGSVSEQIIRLFKRLK